MSARSNYDLVLERQKCGGFTVLVPALPEALTEGDSLEEALAHVEEAIRAVIDYRREHGIPTPRLHG